MGGEPGSQNEAEFTPEIPIYLFPIFVTVGPLCQWDLAACLSGNGVPMVHKNKPLQFFCLALIIEKPFICFSEEAAIKTWTFSEWEGNLLKTTEDCRCKMFLMPTPEQTYHRALAYLLPTQCLYWARCPANCRHINQAARLQQSHCLCTVLSRPYKCVIIEIRARPKGLFIPLWWTSCSLLPVYMNSPCLRGKARLLSNCSKVLCCPTYI